MGFEGKLLETDTSRFKPTTILCTLCVIKQGKPKQSCCVPFKRQNKYLPLLFLYQGEKKSLGSISIDIKFILNPTWLSLWLHNHFAMNRLGNGSGPSRVRIRLIVFWGVIDLDLIKCFFYCEKIIFKIRFVVSFCWKRKSYSNLICYLTNHLRGLFR